MELGMSRDEVDKEYKRGTNEGDKLKSITSWKEDGNGNNFSRFNALPGGWQSNSIDTGFQGLGYYGYWWLSSKATDVGTFFRGLSYGNGLVYRSFAPPLIGLSVRCIKD